MALYIDGVIRWDKNDECVQSFLSRNPLVLHIPVCSAHPRECFSSDWDVLGVDEDKIQARNGASRCREVGRRRCNASSKHNI